MTTITMTKEDSDRKLELRTVPQNCKAHAVTGLHEARPVTACRYCEGTKVIRKGRRRNKFGDIQLYYCHHCKRKFSPLLTRHRTFPVRIVLDALTLHSRLYSLQDAAETVSERYGLRVSRQNVAGWRADFAGYLTFSHWRRLAEGRFTRHTLVAETRLLHGLVYVYKYHRAKTALILEQRKGAAAFAPLRDYLEAVPSSCPHELFRAQNGRASARKGGFDLDGVPIIPRHDNAAVRTARLVLQAVANNKRRHEALQDFMLANDSATVAVEVPVILTADDLAHFAEHGAHIPLTLARGELITGHIDIVQLRYGFVHILDYKPGARRDKPVEQLMIYALALSRATGINLDRFKCAWFDDRDYFEFCPRAVVRKDRLRESAC